MPSVIGSPTRTYTPPSSNDESLPLHATSSHTSVPKLHHLHHHQTSSSSTSLNIHTHHTHDSNAASPPSSSDDSPTTSNGDTHAFTYLSHDDDTEMLDYNYPDLFPNSVLPITTTGDDSSSPEGLFFASNNDARGNNRFTSSMEAGTGLSPFSAALAGLKGNGSSPEYAVEGDSPGLGTDMRGIENQ